MKYDYVMYREFGFTTIARPEASTVVARVRNDYLDAFITAICDEGRKVIYDLDREQVVSGTLDQMTSE